MTASIAIVGMACRYPDARSPSELWENVLAERQAFRRMPDERLRLADYLSADHEAPDCLYSTNAAVIEGYDFDRLRFKIAGSTFRATDPVHWLALDVAAQALQDGGFAEGKDLPRETTGVFLGNTLTGEFSRAGLLRLRWPYVRRTIEASLAKEDWSVERRNAFLKNLEATYKQPFPPTSEESLAGGLSNTIAGRICNYFDFQGGGYTVDGACASSLLAIANGCTALSVGDLDAAVAGGVDLSLDPFELVGFAKAGALATDEMRVYDARSNGFWPGEGCGFVLLMRHEDAMAQGLRVYAVIRGWGISSDGNGGITRPKIDGQLLALRRAYDRADFGIDTVGYLEGHGTGTSVGDSVEVQALSRARREAKVQASPVAIGSIKANIGHTKAAAGVAGLIKTVMALKAGVIPPTTACEEPRAEFRGESPALRTLRKAELWPRDCALRAGVSSMGFGGINAHIVIEAEERHAHRSLNSQERDLSSSAQDAELFLLSDADPAGLLRQVDHLLSFAARLSRAELSDLAMQLDQTLNNDEARAFVVASSPADLANVLEKLRTLIETGKTQINAEHGACFSAGATRPRIGFLFPGQGSPSHLNGGAWRRRFRHVSELYDRSQLEEQENESATIIAQPAIVTASIAALTVLNKLNITAESAVGHSLGELTALHWGGSIDEESLLRIAKVRGAAMMKSSDVSGAMANIGAGAQEILALINGDGVCIAGLNSRVQTVISGEATAIDKVVARAREQKLSAIKLPVSHAFHSWLMTTAVPVLAAHFSDEEFKPLQRTVMSTISGEQLLPDTNLAELLCQQLTSPVRFMEAVTRADSQGVDLWLEVGPGQVLRGIMSDISETPVVSLDAGGESLRGLLSATGAAFVLGHPVNHQALFAGRFTRTFDLDWRPKFFVNPCELAPVIETMPQSGAEAKTRQVIEEQSEPGIEPDGSSESPRTSTLDLVTELIAKRAELPVSAVGRDMRLLSDLHLNSITVAQLVAEIAGKLQLPRPVSPTDFADAKVGEVAQAFDEQLKLGPASPDGEANSIPAGIDSWVRPFRVELVERPLPQGKCLDKPGHWQVLATTENHFAESLRRKFADCEWGNGIVVCLPPNPDEASAGQLLKAARLALKGKDGTRFVLAQTGQGAAAFARTLHLEAPQVTTCVVSVPQSHPQAAAWVVAEALVADGFVEAHYDDDGLRYEPVLRALPFSAQSDDLPLSPSDVLVVTGGGKGITAECAIALAKESGARLALIGLAQPETDQELSANLKRMRAAGVHFSYISADVTDQAQVRTAIDRAERELGKITGILHGAAINVPRLLSTLDEETLQWTLAVKVQGARNLLSAIDPEKLRLLVTFGSIISRTGLRGEAHYGLANEWLRDLTEQWKAEHPSCRCLAVEWSLWSGTGMGQRLAGTDLLMQQGITPIPIDKGVSILRQLLGQTFSFVSVVVTGRFLDMPTLRFERPDLPFLRFLEQPRVYYPGVELIVDVDLATNTDPYLNDHQFNGERLLPAVIGLEAMAQVAMALTGSAQPPIFENTKFNTPIVVPEKEARTIRVAALVRSQGIVEVAVRSEETGFQMDHFAALCRFETPTMGEAESRNQLLGDGDRSGAVPLDPESDLYGSVLFHQGRFRRLGNYRILRSKECLAEITPDGNTAWFSRYLPADLVLGDPGQRDAAVHAIQACIPHVSLLPTGFERLSIGALPSVGPMFVRAQERSVEGNVFTYDACMTNAQGDVVERWEGLRLTAVTGGQVKGPWIESLLGPYLERRVKDLIPTSDISVALVRDSETDRQERSARAINISLGEQTEVFKRPNGKPEVDGQRSVSAAHHQDLTLAVAGPGPIGCDLEPVADRPPCVWRALLGDERIALVQLVERRASENPVVSATRVWAASECLKKAGATVNAPLVFVSSSSDGWVLLSSADFKIATYAAQIRVAASKVVIAILAW